MDLEKPQGERQELPIVFHEQQIMESIENNVVTIVCGETGSGKSTQIPQFILNSHRANPWKFRLSEAIETQDHLQIGITQPRRVAAVSLARRVADELSSPLGETVGYQIRYDSGHFSPTKTKIKFMTDGILLKELESDLLLRRYSVILIDEAHERSLNSDILVSLLSRIAQARADLAFRERSESPPRFATFPLRLVIMSATLRVKDFLENERLFPQEKPRAIKVEARQYPVAMHFSKVTRDDYVEQAFRKVVKIHRTLPQGGVLVFLTGKKEIVYLCKRLQMALKKRTVGAKRQREDSDDSASLIDEEEKLEEQLDV